MDDEACVAYMGMISAGHLVKMVHNGIEYGLRQILAATYDFMWRVLKMDFAQMSDTFAKWNDSELNSFLVEITAEVLRKVDAESGKPLVSMVLDKAEKRELANGLRKPRSIRAFPYQPLTAPFRCGKSPRALIAHKYGCHLPQIDAKLPRNGNTVTSQRVTSAKAERARWEVETAVSEIHKPNVEKHAAKHLAQTLGNPSDERENAELRAHFSENFDKFSEELKNALHRSFIVTYAQGMSLLQTASVEKKYDLNLSEIAKIWRGGYIIRSALLDGMSRVGAAHPDLPNLVLDYQFAVMLKE